MRSFFSRPSRRRGARRRDLFSSQFDGSHGLPHKSFVPLGCDVMERRIVLTASPAADFDFSLGVITGYHGAGGAIKIPPSINGAPVVAIGNNAFFENGQATNPLTSVVIPKSIESIGSQAFTASGLTSVKIGNRVQTIGEAAFLGTGLRSVVIPDSVKTIGSNAFQIPVLASVRIGNGTQTIGEEAFAGGFNLVSVKIGSGVTTIGASAFMMCNLKSVVIPNSVKTIGFGAFFGNTNLATVKIGSGVSLIDKYAFSGTALSRVVIPDSVITIGDGAFGAPASRVLTKVRIGSGVTTIGDGAFSNNTALVRVNFTNAAPIVGTDAFADVAPGAKAYRAVTLTGYGPDGSNFHGLIVATPSA